MPSWILFVALTATGNDFIERYASTYGFRLGAPRRVSVTPEGDAVLFLRAKGPRSFVQELWAFDPGKGTERVLLSSDRVLAETADQLTETYLYEALNDEGTP